MFRPLTIQEFHDRTGLDLYGAFHLPESVTNIVSPRQFVGRVSHFQLLSKECLRAILYNVQLGGNWSVRPYEGCQLNNTLMDPHGLWPIQTFVLEAKLLSIVSAFAGSFLADICAYGGGGVAKCSAGLLTGHLADGSRAVAFYLPPIVEIHDGRCILIDGHHRNYLALSMGVTVETIVIDRLQVPPPADPMRWEQLKMMAEKPPKDERYQNLVSGCFRLLGDVGIDA